MKRLIYTLAFIILLIPSLTISQSKVNLKGKYDLGLNIGLIYNTSVITIDVLSVSNDMNFQGSASFIYWLSNEFAVQSNIGFIASSVNSNVSIGGVEQKTSVITPILFGAKYSPDALSISNNIRPFITGMAGIVKGAATENVVNYMAVTENYYTQSAFSVKSGIGADALIGKYFRLGLMLDYLYMTDFEKVVGTRKNYSGIDISFTFGVMM